MEVTLVDANHCPGAAQLLFALPGGRRYVHVGDFRFHARMLADARLAAFQRADALYLDTTYCKPAHCFPLQARGRGRARARATAPAAPPGRRLACTPAASSRCMRAPARPARADARRRRRGRGSARRACSLVGLRMCAPLARAPGSAHFGALLTPGVRDGARTGGCGGVCGGHAAQAHEGGGGRRHPPPLPDLGARPEAPARCHSALLDKWHETHRDCFVRHHEISQLWPSCRAGSPPLARKALHPPALL